MVVEVQQIQFPLHLHTLTEDQRNEWVASTIATAPAEFLVLLAESSSEDFFDTAVDACPYLEDFFDMAVDDGPDEDNDTLCVGYELLIMLHTKLRCCLISRLIGDLAAKVAGTQIPSNQALPDNQLAAMVDVVIAHSPAVDNADLCAASEKDLVGGLAIAMLGTYDRENLEDVLVHVGLTLKVRATLVDRAVQAALSDRAALDNHEVH